MMKIHAHPAFPPSPFILAIAKARRPPKEPAKIEAEKNHTYSQQLYWKVDVQCAVAIPSVYSTWTTNRYSPERSYCKLTMADSVPSLHETNDDPTS
jgi:hypothetical protein